MQNFEWYLADLKSTGKNTIETAEKSLTDMFIRLVRIYPCLIMAVDPYNNIGIIQMKRKELTKVHMMFSNWKETTLVLVISTKYFSVYVFSFHWILIINNNNKTVPFCLYSVVYPADIFPSLNMLSRLCSPMAYWNRLFYFLTTCKMYTFNDQLDE